jgi:hypothetical protein
MAHTQSKRNVVGSTARHLIRGWYVLAHHSFAGYVFLFLLSFGISLFRSLLIPVVPAIHDEFAYLLQADTFANGRLTNPTTPFWRHFDTFHTIFEPTYNAKYPPGQGFTLAIGQIVFGSPLIGVWLTIALGILAVYAALRAALPRHWALVGGVSVTLHPIVVTWSQGYWGGGLAMTGGALVLTAVLRLVRARGKWRPWNRRDLKYGFLLGLGLGILANSRPFEGMIFAILTIGWLISYSLPFFRQGQLPLAAVLRISGMAMLPLAFILAITLRYNQAVTGSALQLPYTLYAKRQEACSVFLWQKPKAIPTYETPAIERFWLDIRKMDREQRSSFRAALHGINSRFRELIGIYRRSPIFGFGFFYLILISMILEISKFRKKRGDVLQAKVSLFCVVTISIFTIPLLSSLYMFPHYAAPAVALMSLSSFMGLRYLMANRIMRNVYVKNTFISIAVISVVFAFVRDTKNLYSESKKTSEWARQRDQLNREKLIESRAKGGTPVLLIVRYGEEYHAGNEWVFNGADLENAPVLWARDRGPTENQRLLNHYSNRATYLVTVRDANSPATIVPYSGTE